MCVWSLRADVSSVRSDGCPVLLVQASSLTFCQELDRCCTCMPLQAGSPGPCMPETYPSGQIAAIKTRWEHMGQQRLAPQSPSAAQASSCWSLGWGVPSLRMESQGQRDYRYLRSAAAITLCPDRSRGQRRCRTGALTTSGTLHARPARQTCVAVSKLRPQLQQQLGGSVQQSHDQACAARGALLGLAAPGVRHQQRAVELQQDVLDLRLGLLVHVCGSRCSGSPARLCGGSQPASQRTFLVEGDDALGNGLPDGCTGAHMVSCQAWPGAGPTCLGWHVRLQA